MKFLVFLFILVPALEVTVLIGSGQLIGIFPTFFLMIATSVLGAWIAKRQGIAVLQEIRMRVRNGEPPGDALLDGVCVLIGGLFLLFPGYVTDIMGLLLLLPITRKPIKYAIFKWIDRKIKGNRIVIVK